MNFTWFLYVLFESLASKLHKQLKNRYFNQKIIFVQTRWSLTGYLLQGNRSFPVSSFMFRYIKIQSHRFFGGPNIYGPGSGLFATVSFDERKVRLFHEGVDAEELLNCLPGDWSMREWSKRGSSLQQDMTTLWSTCLKGFLTEILPLLLLAGKRAGKKLRREVS